MDYVTDTNVWYHIVDKIVVPRQVFRQNDKVYATAINLIEIASSGVAFDRQKELFKTILEYSCEILPEPVIHLASLFGYNVDTSSVYWRELIMEYLESSFLTKRIVDILPLMFAVNDRYHAFTKTIDRFNDKVVAGHSLVQHKRQIKSKDRQVFIEFYNSKKYKLALFNLLHEYVRIILFDNDITIRTKKKKSEIYPMIEPYIDAHKEYELQCGISIKTHSNDYADLQHFLYLQNGMKLLTSDKRWLKIAKNAGLSKLVIDPPKVSTTLG